MRQGLKASLIVAVGVAVIAAIGFWLFSPREKQVATMVVELAPADRVLAANGRIRPRLEVEIRPVVGGELVALPFDVGSRVSEGQVIARIDDAPETAAILEAQAAIQTQQAVLAQARRDLSRFEALGQFTTRREVEQRRLAVIEGERELKRRQASVLQAQETRERRVIRAPFAGVILERPVDPGQAVGADSVIYRLANLASPEVTVAVDEIYAAEIKQGMAAWISMPGAAGRRAATVSHIEPRVDPQTGARAVRLELGDGTGEAPSGLTVTVNLVIERRDRAISVPRAAITEAGGAARVRVVDGEGKVADRQISFIDWPAQKVIVTRGLKPGERILLDPDAAAVGEKVRQ